MIISFFGHSVFKGNKNLENKTINIIHQITKGNFVYFYLGGYGDFDNFAYNCCLKYKQLYGNCKLVLILPYIDESYLQNRKHIIKKYDDSIYPPLEKYPKKIAIIKRNEDG